MGLLSRMLEASFSNSDLRFLPPREAGPLWSLAQPRLIPKLRRWSLNPTRCFLEGCGYTFVAKYKFRKPCGSVWPHSETWNLSVTRVLPSPPRPHPVSHDVSLPVRPTPLQGAPSPNRGEHIRERMLLTRLIWYWFSHPCETYKG